tara:strand:- start:19735 stop:21594 length:1860 start_codon:yes stop_codon:yes gene_type:complete
LTDIRYPADLVVTVEDFQASGWKEAIAEIEHPGYSSMSPALCDAAKAAMERDEQKIGKVLWLLADACSPMLKPESSNEPFFPMMTLADGRRSVLPDDFSEDDLVFLASIIDEIDDSWLQARVADILWTCVSPRVPAYALAAIDAYRSIPIELDAWVGDGRECWTRAAKLTGLLKKGAGDRITEIADALLEACLKATKDDGYLALWIADLLVEYRLLLKKQLVSLAEHLVTLSADFEKTKDHSRRRDYLNLATKLCEGVDDTEKATDLLVLRAESWVVDAEASPSGLVAAGHYENAIQTYRQVPRKHRDSRKVDEKIAELRPKLNDAGERALGEMGTFTTKDIDISEMVESARSAVRGKSAMDAIGAFASLSQVREESVREAATKSIKEHPISHLFSASMMSNDGRVIAKSPGVDLSGTAEDRDQIAVWAEMLKHYGILISVSTQGYLLPALEVLTQEQRLREGDFRALASASPIVPPDRADLFGKGLFAGYEGDFVTAIHLLVPQIEHMVRYHLKVAGAKTTTLNQQGIETENGLSTLVGLPEMIPVFGEDTAFEIKALFCDSFGPNLRNEIAHGLLTGPACRTVQVVYAWWLCLKLVFMTFHNTQRRQEEAESDGGEE